MGSNAAPYGITQGMLESLLEQSGKRMPFDYSVLESVCVGLVNAYNYANGRGEYLGRDINGLFIHLSPSEILAFCWVADYAKRHEREYRKFSPGRDFAWHKNQEMQKLFEFAWVKIYRSNNHYLQGKFGGVQEAERRMKGNARDKRHFPDAVDSIDERSAQMISDFISSGNYSTEWTIRRLTDREGTSKRIFSLTAQGIIRLVYEGCEPPLSLFVREPYRFA